MLKTRLKRFGRKKCPCYRVVAIDSRSKRDGKALEVLGFYNPTLQTYSNRRPSHWSRWKDFDYFRMVVLCKNGAKCSPTVRRMLHSCYLESTAIYSLY